MVHTDITSYLGLYQNCNLGIPNFSTLLLDDHTGNYALFYGMFYEHHYGGLLSESDWIIFWS